MDATTSAARSLRLAFVVGGLYTESSGVARIVCDLANAVSRHSGAVPVYTAACRGQSASSHMLRPPNQCIAERGWWLGRLSTSPPLRRRLEADIANIDVVHNHSVWMLPNHYASATAHAHGKPVVFTAHGTLEPWALARSGWKKKLVARWFQKRDLERAACIHVNSMTEADGIRRYGLRNPVAIVPNGVDVEPFKEMPARDELLAEFPQLRGKRVALFLSRLHEKKGLRHLIEAWARTADDYPEWHLLMVGPDDGFEAAARALAAERQVTRTLTFAGARRGRAKLQALAAADLFVLPSFSEGFSMAVLEALAAGLPVLITPGCNFAEVETTGVGRIVSADATGTEAGLRELMSLSDDARQAMGRRGREMVTREYTWDAVALKMLEIYHWVSGGPTPVTVPILE